MNRRGMALLLVLWLLVLLTGLAGIGVGRSREGTLHGRNRRAGLRATWAREACLEVMLGTALSDSTARQGPIDRLAIDSLDLGSGIWCRLRLSDPGERVHLNLASVDRLQLLFGDSALTKQIVAGRPWVSIDQLPEVFGPWRDVVTLRGNGRINLLRAPTRTLATIPGVGTDGAGEIVRARGGQPIVSLEALLNRLSRSVQDRIASSYDRFATIAELRSGVLVAEVEGHASDRPVVARMTVTLVSASSRLAVIRREVE